MTWGSFTLEVANRHRWVPFVLPFLVYMTVGVFEPKPQAGVVTAGTPAAAEVERDEPQKKGSRFTVAYRFYPVYYTLRIALTIAAILLFLPVYRAFTPRLSGFAVTVGIVGAVLWIALCRLRLESAVSQSWGIGGLLNAGSRAGFDPFTALGDTPFGLASFLVVRFFGLVLVVSLMEEFFLRGFLMRYVMDPQWWTISVGQAGPLAIAVGTFYGILTHPSEALAAGVWFSMITWLVCKTRNIWDAVTAHAVTNLLLGIYIVLWKDWTLW